MTSTAAVVTNTRVRIAINIPREAGSGVGSSRSHGEDAFCDHWARTRHRGRGGKDAKGTAAANRKRVAHGTLKVTKTGKQKLVVKFTKKAKKAFKTRKKVTLTLVLTVKDAAGNATKKTAKIVLKR
jgi:hypothetical protein